MLMSWVVVVMAEHPTPDRPHRVSDADVHVEIGGFSGEKGSTEKRLNGCTVLEPDAVLDGKARCDGVFEPSHARDSLGSRASVSETAALSEHSDAPVDCADLAIPGADPSDDVAPVVVESSDAEVAEAVAFFADRKAEETSKQVERARTQSRVFSVMQYHRHPETGEVLFTQQQIDDGLRALAPDRYAYIWHRYDRIVEVDEGTGEPTCTGLKGLHCHMVLWFTEDRPTVRTVSDALTIPSARVKPPNEEGAKRSGRGAAEKSFFDLVEYLTHESRGKDAIPGVTQPERRYLIDKDQATKPGKYQYGRGRVVANFDYSAALDRHMAGRVSAAEGGRSLRERRRKLRRAVMEGMTLREAREADPDVYADDLPRLKALAADYEEMRGEEVAEEIGTVWQSAFVLILGASRQGKDTLATALLESMGWLASLAGLSWTAVHPPGTHALERIGRHALVHHEDMRYYVVPRYDDFLRYADPNRAAEADGRFHSRGKPTPRAIVATSTETLMSLGYTLKRRRDSAELAERASRPDTRPRHPIDIDEFLFRIGWYVEVQKPDGVGDDLDAIRAQMMVSIYRVREGHDDPVIEDAHTRGGRWVGSVETRHTLEPVAMIRGCDAAARFLAVSIMHERYGDVVEAMPDNVLSDLLAERAQVSDQSRAVAERQRLMQSIARLDRENKERRRRAEDECRAERQRAEMAERRRAAEEAERARRVDAVRKNGLVLAPTTGR